jgi:hypothetical protein
MEMLKPINLSSIKLSPDQPMTSIELGKLWATYVSFRGLFICRGWGKYFD